MKKFVGVVKQYLGSDRRSLEYRVMVLGVAQLETGNSQIHSVVPGDELGLCTMMGFGIAMLAELLARTGYPDLIDVGETRPILMQIMSWDMDWFLDMTRGWQLLCDNGYLKIGENGIVLTEKLDKLVIPELALMWC